MSSAADFRRLAITPAKRIKGATIRALNGFFVTLVLSTLWILRPAVRVHLAAFDTDRIGEWIQRIDLTLFLATHQDVQSHGKQVHLLVLYGDRRNKQVDIMYRRYATSLKHLHLLDVRNSFWARFLQSSARTVTIDAMNGGRLESFYSGNARITMDTCGIRPSGRPFLSFTASEETRGTSLLKALGISQDASIACLHIRDQAFLAKTFPGWNWDYHNYRNPPTTSFVQVVRELIKRGWTVVRMGREVASEFPIQEEGFIDYGTSSLRSDFLDVYLYSRARLAIAGSISGIDQLAHAFQVPHVATNYIPFDDPRWATENAIVLPALYVSRESAKIVPFSQMIKHRYGSSQEYANAGFDIAYNDPNDITQAVLEMLSRLDGSWVSTTESQQLQRAFWDWARRCGIDDDLPEGPWQQSFTRARLGENFLSKHRHALLN